MIVANNMLWALYVQKLETKYRKEVDEAHCEGFDMLDGICDKVIDQNDRLSEENTKLLKENEELKKVVNFYEGGKNEKSQ